MVVSFGVLALSACATTHNYEARVRSWQGKDAQVLVANWGQPDDTQKISNGDRMFVYSRLRHEPVAYYGIKQNEVAGTSPRGPASELYVKCSTYFEVNPKNIIVNTQFRGDECKWND